MLRSLVGSEMCIRDSSLTGRPGGVYQDGMRQLLWFCCPIFLLSGSLLWACLLYTSDAADDLLCVDLGGRRIIKKQTYKTNRDERRSRLDILNEDD